MAYEGPDDLHKLLWERRDRLNKVKVHQTSLGAELGLPQYTLSRWIAKLQASGGLKWIKADKGNIHSYSVRPPQ